jgi:hypothetical protein
VSDIDGSVSIVPGVSILGVLSNLNYEPWFALAEYVDNAIQSANQARERLREADSDYKLVVRIGYERDNGGRIVIEDNAAGIARSEFARAFKAAEIPPDQGGLSEFGMGMKSASIWFAKNWAVTTQSLDDDNMYELSFDMSSVLRDQIEVLDVHQRVGRAGDHFTRIELWNLNQFLYGRTLGKVREHLREIYRGFLRRDELELWVAGERMTYRDPEILVAADFRPRGDAIRSDSVIWKKDVDFTLDEGAVSVHGWAALRAEGKTNGNGLSLFRRGRLITGTSEAPYRPYSIYGQSNSFRSQRLFGELSIAGLPVSHTKDGFQWMGLEEEFEARLRSSLDSEPVPLIKQAEGYRAKKASRAELKRVREATENTAEVTRLTLSAGLDSAQQSSAVPVRGIGANATSALVTKDAVNGLPSVEDVSRTFSFDHRGQSWDMSVAASYRPAEPRWLVRQVDWRDQGRTVVADITINTGHEFLRQFALGSTDALEAVFRLAVSMVVAETLITSTGDETGATFLRYVDSLLGSALSTRVRSST